MRRALYASQAPDACRTRCLHALHSLVRIIWLLLLLLLRGVRYALLLIVLVIQRRVEARIFRHADAELLEGGVVEDGVLVAS